ncbi:MAG: amidophosphoribosyltransferase [Patescibacteria group bacterium]
MLDDSYLATDCDNKPQESCGVFGIFAPQEDAARLTFYGLLALQHRGQESAGIVSSDFKQVNSVKGMGLVNQVFTETKIKQLAGALAIGHTRYSTAGSSVIENAQPTLLDSSYGPLAVSHNGNLANYTELRQELLKKGHCLNSQIDSELIVRLVIEAHGRNLKQKLVNGLSQIKGAYSLIFLTKNKLYVVRDRWGIRPLILGQINGRGWVIASESTAIESVGGHVIREVKPGEFIEISYKGIETFHQLKSKSGGFCIFEYVYFSKPESIVNNKLVYSARLKSGQLLAREHPAQADYVISVPDSGTAAALGYAQESGIIFQEGLIKSRYVGRTFIQPTQRIRDLGVRLKFSPLQRFLKNKSIVLVDDSVVRGTTITQIIHLLREAGVKNIHLRIASPPFKNLCFLGIDVHRYDELIAQTHTGQEIMQKIGADSLGYLSLTGLKQAVGRVKHGLCTGCFNKKYPIV